MFKNELRLDIDEAVNPDIVGTMTDMSGVADAAVDAVFSSHNIEHLYPHEVPVALAEPAYTSPAGPIAPLILYGHRPPMARSRWAARRKPIRSNRSERSF